MHEPTSMKVSAYAQKYVPLSAQGKFYALMARWDKGPGSAGAFYDMSVLRGQHKASLE